MGDAGQRFQAMGGRRKLKERAATSQRDGAALRQGATGGPSSTVRQAAGRGSEEKPSTR